MLPWIMGAVAVAVLSSALGESEKSEKKKCKRQLKKQHDRYSKTLQKKQSDNEKKKRSMLFSQIKREQSSLKDERRHFIAARNGLSRGSKAHRDIGKQIKELSQLIERKQQDANRVRL